MFHSLYHRQQELAFPPIDESPENDASPSALLSWPASYMDGVQDWMPEHWQLEVTGLVERPHAFSLKELMGFTRIQQSRRLVFADGLTFRANWEGFVVQELLHRVAPKPQARFLIQTSLSGHQECLPIKDLYSQRALFCLRAEGEALPALHGGPIRLMVFDRYAHKGMGQLARLELSDHEISGHFAGKNYEASGRIEPGDYYATDLRTLQHVATSEEITQW